MEAVPHDIVFRVGAILLKRNAWWLPQLSATCKTFRDLLKDEVQRCKGVCTNGALNWSVVGRPLKCKEPILSNIMHAGQNRFGRCGWRLLLFPKGNDVPGFRSLYLKPVLRKNECHCFRNVSIHMGDTRKTEFNFATRDSFGKHKMDWGFRYWQIRTKETLLNIKVKIKLRHKKVKCMCRPNKTRPSNKRLQRVV